MKTYIINLERCAERKEYMSKLLDKYPCIKDRQFIKAVDGSTISDSHFDSCQAEALRRYGRHIKKGEIGCALSHRKCYEMLLESGDDHALILEDDIVFLRNPEEMSRVMEEAEREMARCDDGLPKVVLLHGDYWWLTEIGKHDFASFKKVYDAVGTLGYMINRSAARSLLANPAKTTLADDWSHVRACGVELCAVCPHVIDHNWSDFESLVSTDGYDGINRKHLGIMGALRSYMHAVVKRSLASIGHFEAKLPIPEDKSYVIKSRFHRLYNSFKRRKHHLCSP